MSKQNDLSDLNLLATASTSQPTTSTSAFLKYRSHDSSSEASSSIKSKRVALFKCEYCEKTFNKSYNYKRHLFLHESKTNEDSSSNNSGSFFVNECPKCKRRILDKSNYAKHVKICYHKSLNKIKLFSYPSTNHCSEASSIPIANADANDNAKRPKQRGFQCEICNKIFNKKFFREDCDKDHKNYIYKDLRRVQGDDLSNVVLVDDNEVTYKRNKCKL